MSHFSKVSSRLLLFILSVFLAFCALFYLCYNFDNKYTVNCPQPINGILLLDENTLEQFPIIYPILDWEIYRGKLLSPDDFLQNAILPDELTFIGQYNGFEGHISGGVKRSPHGSATYRMNIFLPDELQSYTLELPEIYSAYKLYINGVLVKEMGETDAQNYRPQTGISTMPLTLSGRSEIIIAVSDYSNIYSGMVYPPAFGRSDDISHHMNLRLILRSSVVVISFSIGLFYLVVGLYGKLNANKSKRYSQSFLYALLCMFFTFYISYPVVKIMLSVGMGFYILERFSYCMSILLIILIQNGLTGIITKKTKIFIAFGLFACTWTLFSAFFLDDSLNMMMMGSNIIQIYTLAAFLYLTISSIINAYKGVSLSLLLLAGLLAFDAALVMDLIFPMFEPIRFGWFVEVAGAILVMVIGIALAVDIAKELHLKKAIESRVENMNKMILLQKTYYPVLLEKEKETQAARHDLRHHVSVIKKLLSEGKIDELQKYLSEYDERIIPVVHISYCKHYIVDMLLRMYVGLAKTQETDFLVKVMLPEELPISDTDICSMLSNILENALEASLHIPSLQREIVIYIEIKKNHLCILVENSFDGKFTEKNGQFISKKQKNRVGIGILSIQSAIKHYGGSTDFYANGSRFFSEIYIPLYKETGECRI